MATPRSRSSLAIFSHLSRFVTSHPRPVLSSAHTRVDVRTQTESTWYYSLRRTLVLFRTTYARIRRTRTYDLLCPLCLSPVSSSITTNTFASLSSLSLTCNISYIQPPHTLPSHFSFILHSDSWSSDSRSRFRFVSLASSTWTAPSLVSLRAVGRDPKSRSTSIPLVLLLSILSFTLRLASPCLSSSCATSTSTYRSAVSVSPFYSCRVRTHSPRRCGNIWTRVRGT